MKQLIVGLIVLGASLSAQARSFKDSHIIAINAIQLAAEIENVPTDLLMAVCWHESNLRTSGVTHMDGGSLSFGMCQIKFMTAKFMDNYYHNKRKVTSKDLDREFINARYAAQYLRYNLQMYEGNWRLAVDAYNKGNAVSAYSVYVGHIMKSLAYIRRNMETE